MMFAGYTTEDIKEWLTEKKVLFVTNPMCRPGTTFLSSIKTYIDYVPIHNFHIIYGIVNDKPFYGVDAFLEMIAKCYSDSSFKKFDYVIYIDEDAFITDFKSMLSIFYNFIENDEFCLAGPQDGGVICHRNHKGMMINTFISFWNMKMLRNVSKPNDFLKVLNEINASQDMAYTKFETLLKQRHPDTYSKMFNVSNAMIICIEDYRKKTFNNKGESPYCNIVRDDPNNPVEPHQTPYSVGKETNNYEPYYIIEQAMVLLTGLPIYYMNATDYYNPEESDVEMDNSGLTSAVYDNTWGLFCVHTWFSRGYSKWPKNNMMLEHTKRINKVITKYGKI